MTSVFAATALTGASACDTPAGIPGASFHGFPTTVFTNSGSESVDTALKIALAYQRLQGHENRTRLIGRHRGYHGVNFGGISVGGIPPNRKMFTSNLINGVDHISHTHNLSEAAYSQGQPEWGGHLAEELEALIAPQDEDSIAALIVEPVAGATGILPPPLGYLERLREICTKHGILLIFEVQFLQQVKHISTEEATPGHSD